jgi:preprotein translocase SecE subunit
VARSNRKRSKGRARREHGAGGAATAAASERRPAHTSAAERRPAPFSDRAGAPDGAAAGRTDGAEKHLPELADSDGRANGDRPTPMGRDRPTPTRDDGDAALAGQELGSDGREDELDVGDQLETGGAAEVDDEPREGAEVRAGDKLDDAGGGPEHYEEVDDAEEADDAGGGAEDHEDAVDGHSDYADRDVEYADHDGAQAAVGRPVGVGGGRLDAAPRRVPARELDQENLVMRTARFLQGSWRELQRVQWPDRRQVMQATGVVIGFVIVAGVILGLSDLVSQKIVNFIINH